MDEGRVYVCGSCFWEYNELDGCPEEGIAPGTKWEDVPETFKCPVCRASKDKFYEQDED